MSFWNKTLAVFALALTMTLPAVADGTPGQRVNRGPEPVRAHQPVPPEPGCYLIEDGKAWSCPARLAKAEPVPTRAAKPCCGTTTRTVVKEHPPVVTKRMVTHRSAPAQRTVTRRAVTTRRTPAVPVSNEVHLDMASFSGGVGSGVSGGYYGGGGAVLISSGRSYSGVLSHGASSFTFRSRRGRRGGGGGGGGCGCMGGGMGGGD
ncbi:MAG: hypothetical protein AAGL99_16375 [Pseudomonadota bacterium]